MDIDIDLPTTFDPANHFPVTLASRVFNGELKKHPCGVYFQQMPRDPVTGLAAIPYKDASEYGYMKVDFLHLHVLDYFKSKHEIRALMKKTPKWGLLLRADVVPKLFQLNNSLDVLRKLQPNSTLELADCISIIRPGKQHLLDKYLINKEHTRLELYRIEKGSYAYKKGHAIAYAMVVILQLHLIEAGIL